VSLVHIKCRKPIAIGRPPKADECLCFDSLVREQLIDQAIGRKKHQPETNEPKPNDQGFSWTSPRWPRRGGPGGAA